MHVTDKSIWTNFTLHLEHEVFTMFDSQKKAATNCFFPTRVFQDISSLAPSLLTKTRKQNSMVLNIEDYSVLEKSTFLCSNVSKNRLELKL